jgi:hypothetical protein
MVATISRKLNIRRLLAWLGLLFVLGTVAQADEQELATQGKNNVRNRYARKSTSGGGDGGGLAYFKAMGPLDN